MADTNFLEAQFNRTAINSNDGGLSPERQDDKMIEEEEEKRMLIHDVLAQITDAITMDKAMGKMSLKKFLEVYCQERSTETIEEILEIIGTFVAVKNEEEKEKIEEMTLNKFLKKHERILRERSLSPAQWSKIRLKRSISRK
ncbi:MAG: hypothetical protein ABH896_02470 [Candidatus Jacksonbacteria bacterium]